MKKHLLYIIVIAASLTGSLWIYWNSVHYTGEVNSGMNLCLFKRVTGIPCPSCGTTRSLLYISKLEPGQALFANPFSFILAFAILVFPFWVLYDVVTRKSSFYTFYGNTESFIQKRWVALPLIVLVLANWFWNIHKHY